jgi:hypothetical protein
METYLNYQNRLKDLTLLTSINKMMGNVKSVETSETKPVVRNSKTKDYEKNYNKEYYLKHRAERLIACKERMTCELCNCSFTIGKLGTHKKSKKHLLNEYQKNDLKINK